MRNKEKQYTFFEGTAVLLTAVLLAKIFGAAFKIPLASLLGGEGMGYYMTAYSIFGPLSAVALSGMTMAVSKLTAELYAKGWKCKAGLLLKSAILTYFAIGFILSMVIWIFALPLTILLGNPQAVLCVKAIAPSLIFCCISSAIRGYYEGNRNMYPTAFSQVLESASRLVLGSVFAFFAAKYAIDNPNDVSYFIKSIVHAPIDESSTALIFASSAAILGVTLSTAIGSIYVIFKLLFDKIPKPNCQQETNLFTKQLLSTALPICACTIAANLASFIDLFTVVNKLNFSISFNESYFNEKFAYAINTCTDISSLSVFLFGAYSGIAMTIFNIIPTFCTAISTSALPSIAFAYKNNSPKVLSDKISEIVKFSAILSFGGGFGLSVLSKPVLTLLFPQKTAEVICASEILQILGIAAASVGVLIVLNCVCQAIGKTIFPLKVMIMAGVIKLILNFVLISIPTLNIKGAAISTTIAYTLAMITEYFYISNNLKCKIKLYNTIIKPFICAIICALTAYVVQGFFTGTLSNTINILITLVISMSVYGVILMITGTFNLNFKNLFNLSEKS